MDKRAGAAGIIAAELAAKAPPVGATVGPAIGRTEARVTIETRDGRTLTRHVEHALGTLLGNQRSAGRGRAGACRRNQIMNGDQ